MKRILFAATLLSLPVTAVQAQMVFDGAGLSLSAIYPTSGSPVVKYGVQGRAAVSFGNIGLQGDMALDRVDGSPLTSEIYNFDYGIHANYRFDNGLKTGVFYARESWFFGLADDVFTTYGAEVMAQFGKLTLEASAAGMHRAGSSVSEYVFTADAYYQLSSPVEINAGVIYYFDPVEDANVTIASIGGVYSFSNLPLSLALSYSNASYPSLNISANSITAEIRYQFGGNSDWRPFKTRSYGFLDRFVKLQ